MRCIEFCRSHKLLHGYYDRVEEAVMRNRAGTWCCWPATPAKLHAMLTHRIPARDPCAVMPLKGEDLRMLTPKPAAVFAVTDENLACAGPQKASRRIQ